MNGVHGRTPAPRRVAYVIGTYPLLTTTFIDREVAQLRRHGLDVQLVALRRPTGPLSPEQQALRAQVRYLLPVPFGSLAAAHLRFMVRRPAAFWGVLGYLLTRPHPSLRSRLRTLLHFGQGVAVADLLRAAPACGHVHAHFIDRAAVVALVASRLLGVGYSATAHANDIYVAPVLLAEKVTQARFVATCTLHNAGHLATALGAAGHALNGSPIVCVRHGLDVKRYQPGLRDGDGPPVILAVAQLKEKKGLADLLAACRLLRDRGRAFTCDIVGDGPLRARLEAQVRRLRLEDTVTLWGALPHPQVVERYRAADLFALPCVTGPDGDRDGIPNVVLEAMAMQLPVVSTRHSGIPEAVTDGWNGTLVAPGDPGALADALGALLDDPDRRRTMGRRGRAIAAARFDVAANAKDLLACFEEAMA